MKTQSTIFMLIVGIIFSGINQLYCQDNLKTIYIVRHAKSNHDNPTLTDFERPLETKGEENAKTVGELLSRKKINIDLIISSPSKRTVETTRIICKEINYDFVNVKLDPSIYQSTLENYVDIIKNIDNTYQSVMVIGHNPASTQLANFLQAKLNISDVPTAGIVAIQFTVKTWKEISSKSAELLFFYDPDDITKTSD